ncbi:hypothetical protein B0H13DRAFT_1855113 [Mycena leptocephala]|nr:hypothetical protein B0H13DRAFT_1855113 [Mycena leptocephala]
MSIGGIIVSSTSKVGASGSTRGYHMYRDPDDHPTAQPDDHGTAAQPKKKPRKSKVVERRVKAIETGQLPRTAALLQPTLPASASRKVKQTKERSTMKFYIIVCLDNPPLPPSERQPPIVQVSQGDGERKAEMASQMKTAPAAAPMLFRLTQLAVGLLQQIAVASAPAQSETPIVIDLLQQAIAKLQISPSTSSTRGVEVTQMPPPDPEPSFTEQPSFAESFMDVDLPPLPSVSPALNVSHPSIPHNITVSARNCRSARSSSARENTRPSSANHGGNPQ